MKKLSIALVFCLAFAGVSAQDQIDNWMQSEGTLEGFVVGNQYFTLVSDANLRDKPGTQSKVLAKLPIGTPVTILSVSSDSFLLRGVKLPWVEVRTQTTGSASIKGYIWGGFLALASIQTPDEEYTPNRGVLYLTGVAAYEEAQHQLTIQVRVAQGGKELSKTEFTTHGDLSYYPSFKVDFVPFSGVKALIAVNYYYPACGYPSGNNLLFWRENNQLDKVLETTSISEGGIFYDSEEYILPTDKGGIGDHILVVKDQSEFEERGDIYVRSKQTFQIAVHKWTGSKLVKVKEIK